MHTRTSRFFQVVLIAISGMIATPAIAQKSCEERVVELEEQIKRLEQRVKDLAAQNAALNKSLTAAGGSGRAPAKAPPAGSANPLLSPESLLEALKKDYTDKLGSMPRDTRPEQAKYATAAREWVRETTRAFRGPIDWTIQVVKIEGGQGTGKPAEVTFRAYDANEKKAVGVEVTQPFPVRFIPSLSEEIGTKVWKLAGTIAARPVYNEKRTADTASALPAYIGPSVEFGFDLIVSDVQPVEAK